MGLEKIYQMTNVATYRLRIEYLTTGGKWYSEEYDSFSVGPESSYYVLSVPSSGYYDDAELLNNIFPFPNYLTNGMPFSTTDQDHDNVPGSSCADTDKGGWWYNGCTWIMIMVLIFGQLVVLSRIHTCI